VIRCEINLFLKLNSLVGRFGPSYPFFYEHPSRVGVIGLGIIGAPRSKNLRKAGFDVYVWNRTPKDEPQFVHLREFWRNVPSSPIFVANDAAILER